MLNISPQSMIIPYCLSLALESALAYDDIC